MVKFNSHREVVRQLIRSYMEACQLHNDLENLGIQVKAVDFLGEHCADCAMDIIGFPVDDTVNNGDFQFCRDWLFDAAPMTVTPETLDAEVDKYVDFLYFEFESLKKESPNLFE